MHHAIEYQHFSTPSLQVGPRKRSPMGQLLRVTRGAALLRLGAHELLLTEGCHFWLCADALAALTPLAGCQYDLLACSVRVAQPAQAGWLQASPLMDALLDNLATWSRPRDWQGPFGERLRILGDELQACVLAPQPDTALQTAWQALASQQPGSDTAWQALLAERGLGGPDAQALQEQWRLLQGVRLRRSGSTPAQVVARLGYRDDAALAEASLRWLGHALDAEPSPSR
ncbi:hypothetical protein ACL00O_10195 [Aeromonas sanarellii]|uniref:hypothetical protein n=1 Tax=Aeromonas sanarellii TaxID=633415 RepID=UPI0039A02BCB